MPSVNRSALVSCIAGLGLTGCVVFGINNVEEAAYSVVQSDGDYELRAYAPLTVARTVVDAEFDKAGSIAFRRLFGYISGDNIAEEKIAMASPVTSGINDNIASEKGAAGEKIEMTAPVIEERSATGWTFSFVLPAAYSIDSAPQPLDDRIELAEIPEKEVAVLIYSGRQKETIMQSKLQELESWIENNNLTAASEPRWAAYNPPFTLPFLRRNEVMIDVD